MLAVSDVFVNDPQNKVFIENFIVKLAKLGSRRLAPYVEKFSRSRSLFMAKIHLAAPDTLSGYSLTRMASDDLSCNQTL